MNTWNIVGWSVWGLLALANISIGAYYHGKPKPNYNYWVTLTATVLDFAVMAMVAIK